MLDRLKLKIWNIIKKKFKIKSWDIFKADLRRNVDSRIYVKKYDVNDIIELMRTMGLKRGANIFIHSSWSEFYNFNGNPSNLIDAVLMEIGLEGTLAMPAYPLLRKPESIFNIKSTPTQAGIIAETFRNYPGVKRSINKHSVCALGPKADFLLNEHQYSITSWDEKSPYYKLSQIDALVFTFGLGKYFVGTIMHCADSVLREEIPYFSQFFQKKYITKFKLPDQSIYEQESLGPSENFNYYFTDLHHNKIITRFFDNSKFQKKKISNLTVNVYQANYFINRAIELGKKGIVVYLKPDPKKFTFPNN